MCPALLETISPPRVLTAGQIPQLDGHRTLGFSLVCGGVEGRGGGVGREGEKLFRSSWWTLQPNLFLPNNLDSALIHEYRIF